MSKPLYIYGASGHAKVVIDIAEKMGGWEIRGVLDDNLRLKGTLLFGYPVLGGSEQVEHLDKKGDSIFVAIGANNVRFQIGERLRKRGIQQPTLIHPAAIIGRDVTIGSGTVVMAGVVINPCTSIGDYCILNTGCSVDHDANLGDAVHISPGARLAGNVTVGDLSWVGIGSCVIEGRTIGKCCMIGGGAAVINDLPDDVTAVGVPAKIIRMKSPELSEVVTR